MIPRVSGMTFPWWFDWLHHALPHGVELRSCIVEIECRYEVRFSWGAHRMVRSLSDEEVAASEAPYSLVADFVKAGAGEFAQLIATNTASSWARLHLPEGLS